jgi:hypothetical protein
LKTQKQSRSRVDQESHRRATKEPKGIFDYKVAYEIAKKITLEKVKEKKKREIEPEKYWLP